MTSKMVSITLQSQDRDKDAWPSASDFVVQLNRRVERVKEVRLGTIELPCGPPQMTVEHARNDNLHFSEGIRVDTGEEPRIVLIDDGPFNSIDDISFNSVNSGRFGYPRNEPSLYNNQICIAQANHEGKYTPELNIYISVPPWLAEVERRLVTGTVDQNTKFQLVSTNGVPLCHGLSDYQNFKSTNDCAPDVTSVAMCTFTDIHFHSSDDVVIPPEPVPSGCETLFSLTPACVGYVGGVWDATAPTKLNAIRRAVDQKRYDCVANGFIHMETIHQKELCAFLNHAISTRNNRLNDYQFSFVRGRYVFQCVTGIYHHSTGVSSRPRLFFPMSKNADIVVPPDLLTVGKITSLGYLMGFVSGADILCKEVKTRPGGPSVKQFIVLGSSPPQFTCVIPAGFYDPSTLADAVSGQQNWGKFDGGIIGTGDTGPVSQFGLRDSLGHKHTVVIRSGIYYPPQLAAAIEYQLNRLDLAGIYASTASPYPASPRIGSVKYTITYNQSSERFTIQCNRVSNVSPVTIGAAVDFGLSFAISTINNASSNARVGCTDIARTLGFDTRIYTGCGKYVGDRVKIPSHPNSLSQGLYNGTVRSLESLQPGTVSGYGAGPWTRRYPSNIYALTGTTPNTKRYCHQTKSVGCIGDGATTRGLQSKVVASVMIEAVTATGSILSASIPSGQPTEFNLAIGQYLAILAAGSGGVIVITGTSNNGRGFACAVMSPGVDYTVGGASAFSYCPQGSLRVAGGNTGGTDDGKHRILVSRVIAEEALPSAGNTGTFALGSRWFRSTSCPLGYQVGDVVRMSADLSVNGSNETYALSVNVVAVRSSVTNTYPYGLDGAGIGEVLKATVANGGTGWVRGSCVMIIGGDGVNCTLMITSTTSAGAVTDVAILCGGTGYIVSDSLPVQAITGPYPTTAVIIESVNAGMNLIGDASVIMRRTATSPSSPISNVVTGASCLTGGTRCISSSVNASPTNTMDGSCARLRVSQNIYVRTAANSKPFAVTADLSDPFSVGDQFLYPVNMTSIKPMDPPRFEILIEGSNLVTGSRPNHVYKLLGLGHVDLWGGCQYTGPAQWCIGPVPYVIIRLHDGHGHTEFNIINFNGGQTSNVLGKICLGSSFSIVNQQMLQLGTGGYRSYERVRLQILNPDFTPYRFHGTDFSISLCFVYDSDDVLLPCT